MPQLEVAAKINWCIHIGHCCDWASLTTLSPKCWTHYIWMKSMPKLDYIRGQFSCLVLYRQTEIHFTSALNHMNTSNWCMVSVIPKAPCMALAELVLLWLGAGVMGGQVWAALLLWWAPWHTLRRGKTERGNGESKSVLRVPQRYSVCCGFSKQLLISMAVYLAYEVLAMGALPVSPYSVRQTVHSGMLVSF